MRIVFAKISGLVLFLLFSYQVYYSIMAKDQLKKYGVYTTGEVIDMYAKGTHKSYTSAGHVVRYSYVVNDIEYTGSVFVSESEWEKYNIGDTFRVLYSYKKPKYSKIFLDE